MYQDIALRVSFAAFFVVVFVEQLDLRIRVNTSSLNVSIACVIISAVGALFPLKELYSGSERIRRVLGDGLGPLLTALPMVAHDWAVEDERKGGVHLFSTILGGLTVLGFRVPKQKDGKH